MRIVAGTARSRTILAPEGRDTRPTLDRVRENLFNILQWHCRDAQVLDLFAGSGALALEALSRGAAGAVLADRDPRAVRIERQNVENLGFADRARVIQAEWQETLRRLAAENMTFQLVFLDPPYAMKDLSAVFEALRSGGMIDETSLLVVEHKAEDAPFVGDGFIVTDQRKYGYAGIHMFRMKGEA